MVGQALNPQQQYLKTQIETATQPQLLLMLFDGAVKKLHLSKKAIEKKEIEKAHTELTKVQRIFTELMIALDMEKGGELAENLMRIYDFVYHHLVKANIRQDTAMIDEVLPIVSSLREGWVEAVKKYEEEAPQQPQKNVQSLPSRFSANNSQPSASPDKATFSKPGPATPPKQPTPLHAAKNKQNTNPKDREQEQERPRLNLQG
ncbi:flagellar export chaperone FliS [bacterium]|nr:flagellar export chaperone FliS [bacterium]